MNQKIKAKLDSLEKGEYLYIDNNMKMKVVKIIPKNTYTKGRIIVDNPKKFLKELWGKEKPELVKKFKPYKVNRKSEEKFFPPEIKKMMLMNI